MDDEPRGTGAFDSQIHPRPANPNRNPENPGNNPTGNYRRFIAKGASLGGEAISN